MRKPPISPFVFLSFVLLGVSSNSFAVPVDLSTWPWSSFGPVSFADGGYTAIFMEDPSDPFFNPISLESSLLIPSDADSFSFDYELIVASENEDYFDFYFNDTVIPVFSVPVSAESDAVYTGSYTVSLDTYTGTTIPIIFHLIAGWSDSGYDSVLTIRNVDLSSTTPVPEPGTLALLCIGLAGLARLRYRR